MLQTLPAYLHYLAFPFSKSVLLILCLAGYGSPNALAQFNRQWVTQPMVNGTAKVEFRAQTIDQAQHLITAGYSGEWQQDTRIVLFKHNANGQNLWKATYNSNGTSLWDTPIAIKTDAAGNIYLLGWSQQTPDVGQAFIAKYTPTGTSLWVVPLGNESAASTFEVAPSGEVYAIATTAESVGYSSVIHKIDAGGKIAWTKDFIGNDGKGGSPHALTLDGKGHLLVGGTLYERWDNGGGEYVVRLLKYNTQNGAKTFTGEYTSDDTNMLTDYESMEQILVAPSGDIYLVTQKSGLYVYQVILFKLSEAGAMQYSKAVGLTDESTFIKAVLHTDGQITLLNREFKYRAIWDYFLTAFNGAGERLYYQRYNEYIPETRNIKRIIPLDLGLAPDGQVAVAGARDYIERPPTWFMEPTVLEPARATVILYNTSGQPTWAETRRAMDDEWDKGFALGFTSANSFYLAGRQLSGSNLVASSYTSCGGFAVTVSPDNTICQGQETRLEASGGVLYSWSPAAGLSGTSIANPVASPTQTTTYTVTATSATGCTATAQVTVTVSPKPQASITAAGPLAFCQGGEVTLSAVASKATNGTTYQWFKDNQELDGATAHAYTAKTSGVYTVRVSIGSCSKTSNAVTVNATPAISNNSLGQNQLTCLGNSPQPITGQAPSGGGGYIYRWESSTTGPNEGFIAASGSNDGLHYTPPTPLTATTWFRRVVLSGTCSSVSQPVKVEVSPLPAVSFSALSPTCLAADAFALTGGSPAGGTYSGPGVSKGIFSPAAAGAGSHTITYTYTSPSGCTSSKTQLVTVASSCNITSIDPDDPDLPVSVYPNPNTSEVHIAFELSAATDVVLKLMDTSGRVVHVRQKARAQKINETIDLAKYKRGLYLLQIETKDGVLQRKLVLQ